MIHNSSPLIKICGLTDPFNALECAKLGADAIGLVFYKKSPRFVTDEKAAAISNILPKDVMPTGVFVDESYDFIMKKAKKCRLKAVQLHGIENPDLVQRLKNQNLCVIKALFAVRSPYLNEANQYQAASFLLVEYGKGKLPGGNAESWSYEMIGKLRAQNPIMLAGGLNPNNVAAAIRQCRPKGVDVSSGVEKSHGVKDLDSVQKLIDQIRLTSH
ncbi:MAG: phosphoribosylanthranilate isomerase [Desulfobacteraceae bacterium]|nr:phosphoribosylanthranilate isomerase [Desulfobacteraceae bacterium]